jgi:hypothetical protein
VGIRSCVSESRGAGVGGGRACWNTQVREELVWVVAEAFAPRM